MKMKPFGQLITTGFLLFALPVEAQRILSISQLFDLVEQHSKSLQVQLTGIEVARQGVSVAKSQRLPDISGSLSASYLGNVFLTDRHFSDVHGQSSPHFGNSFSLDAQQLVYSGGALTAGVRKAEVAVQQAEAQASLTREQQRFVALGQYLDLRKIDNRMQVVRENIDLTKKLVAQIKDKMEQGVALKNDVTRYELQLQSLQLQLTELQDSRSIINHELCNTLGITSDERLEPSDSIFNQNFSRLGEASWQQAAALSSPVIKLSRLNEQRAVFDERIARADLRPKLSLFAADHLNGPITYELPPIDRNINVWYVGVSLSYSFSSLFKSNHKVAQARKSLLQAQQNTLSERERIDNAMQEAHTLYEQAYVQLATQQKNVELARENYQVVNDRYMNQLVLVTDMVDASNMKLEAELKEVDARINIAYAYYKMKYIAGTL